MIQANQRSELKQSQLSRRGRKRRRGESEGKERRKNRRSSQKKDGGRTDTLLLERSTEQLGRRRFILHKLKMLTHTLAGIKGTVCRTIR